MPWTPKDATQHDKKASSGIASRQWSDVANSVLKRTGDEGLAVREANGVVKKRFRSSANGIGKGDVKKQLKSDMTKKRMSKR